MFVGFEDLSHLLSFWKLTKEYFSGQFYNPSTKRAQSYLPKNPTRDI